MNELASRGIKSVVDLTVIGLGRYIPRIQRVAAGDAAEHHRGHRNLHL